MFVLCLLISLSKSVGAEVENCIEKGERGREREGSLTE